MNRRQAKYAYRRHQPRNRKNNDHEGEASRPGNQLSVSVIFLVFILILAYTNSSVTENMRKKVLTAINRNVIEEFGPKDNLKDNITGFVKCMFSVEEGKNAEEKITDDIKKTEYVPSVNGNSLQKDGIDAPIAAEVMAYTEDWIDPVDNGIVSSLCGNRTNPVLDVEEYHNGLDIAADEGSNVYAVRSGTITDIHTSATYGNTVSFETDDGYTIIYSHLKEILVNVGEKVTQGEVIAYVGSTGLVTGPHLHYTVYLDTMLMDPIQFTDY